MSEARTDVALLFPPATEARLFAYLSLPMLTAYLRQHGALVAQRDLNIELCHALLAHEPLERFIAATPGDSLAAAYRRAMAAYIQRNLEALRGSVFAKAETTPAGIQHDVRFVRQGVEMLLESSLLRREFTSLAAMVRATEALDAPPASDVPAQILGQMLAELLGSARPRILGISVAFFSQLAPALLLARWARQHDPELVIVLGGPQIMLRGAELAAMPALRPWIDALCVGPGEACLLALHASVARGERSPDVPELVWLARPDRTPTRSRVHINELPAPDFTDLPYRHYLAEEAHLSMLTCVGCYWGRCVFCSYGNRSLRDRSYQQGSPRWIAHTCAALIERHGIRRINFVDENTNLKVVLQAMRLLAERGHRMQFSTRNRLEHQLLDPAFCRELAAHGCVLMSVGYETNSQRLLDRLDKGVDAGNYQTIIDNLHGAGITLRFSVMGGLLDETEAEVAASREFLRRNADRIGIDVMQMLVLEPTTRLAAEPERYGLRQRPGDELRGNRLLNYGMGRMGPAFDFHDGDSFEPRLVEFLSIFRAVDPQKNDELPPHRRPRQRSRQRRVARVTLHPWVRVLDARVASDDPGDRRVLVDMLWERFYPLPAALAVSDAGEFLPASEDASAQSLAGQLIDLGLVGTVVEEGMP